MQTIIIDNPESIGHRIDSFLTQYSVHSRSKVSEMIKSKKILCNNQPVKANYKVKFGDIITIGDYVPNTRHLTPISMPLDIVYEDDHLMVINKPKYLPVHGGKGIKEPTLVDGVFNHIKPLKPGIVHRIDKDTSGLLVIAKNDISHNHLANQLLDKTMNRRYIALVEGLVDFETLTVNAPIGVDSKDSKKMAIDPIDGKTAITIIKLIERYKNHSLVECQLLSGRTHQIRVHLSHIGHPIIEDTLYNPYISNGEGQYLCAYRIEFKHPYTQETMKFEIELPNSFKSKINQLSSQ